ncbi:putative PurR-regulated permease PerM [Glaciihabitans tibetensis]|uniref:Putative PurR-regulated permease PerM n=1 Tax=Glaciihabitans tibetensis TaxID=1266600 RepID=A0A2T0V490_9MICO|nr:AI-2E family transporter [Glaciihabitans tibetensis]PRY64993.1 putative PurR-regulated permease PerM [Glaciihabitans tibetensis]
MMFGKKLDPPAVRDVRKREVESSIPLGIEIAGAWSWRILAVAGVAVVFGLLIIQLQLIVVPFMIAVLVAALLVPIVQLLVRHRWPKGLAVAVTMIVTLGVLSGLIVLIVTQIRSGYPDLQDRSVTAYQDFKTFLSDTWNIDNSEFNDYLEQAVAAVQTDSQALVSGAVSLGSTAGHVLTGSLLTLFATLFILIDGAGIWNWIVRIFPRKARAAVDGSGRAGWLTLTTFVKVQIFVAAIDATGIGLGAWILGLFFGGFPLIIPIAVAVFLGSFIPVVGAVVTGAIAIFVALIYLGPVPALIMLAIVLAVQQLEGHVLQPLVMGSAVKIHPLAVVFAVAAGSFIAGIPGALFAVPVVAVLNVMVTYVASGRWRGTVRPQIEDVATRA